MNTRPFLRASPRAWAFALLLPLFSACQSALPGDQPAKAAYTELVRELSGYIESELADKGIPGISIALVDGDQVVWSAGFGSADPERGARATADTIYRVGSVSKLFTDIGVMQLVEQGRVDLDAPVQRYLPEFTPSNPFDEAISLRQLMSHRSGLVREPPVGHYFDDSSPSLAATVESLNSTTLVYAPESRIKYSNAAIAVVGYVLERLSGEPFAQHLKAAVLEPIGMRSSSFEPTSETERRLSKARMWSFDGRDFPAPTFELGMSPAGSMYSSVNELCGFISMIFDQGQGSAGDVLGAESLAEMLRPQYAPEGATSGYGLGFRIGEIEGQTSYGHGGAIYGFATSLKMLPGQELGAVVIANMDVVNSVTGRIVDQALRMMLAQRAGEPLPSPPSTRALAKERVSSLEGHYRSKEDSLDLRASGDQLILAGARSHARVREAQGKLVLDDRHRQGPELVVVGDGELRLNGRSYQRSNHPKPTAAADRFRGLIGEYGWDHNVLFIYEKAGQLHALIEWTEIDPLTELSDSRFAFPPTGLYHGEQIEFERDADGRATEAIVAGLRFPRRVLDGESEETFSIEKLHSIEQLRRQALAAEPPSESGDFLDTEFVELTSLDPGIHLDIRYASTNNFMQSRFYDEPRAFMQREAAEAVVRVHRGLEKLGYGLLIHDAYRPWYVTKMFWDATPAESKDFVADPAEGSRHNRGCAVDLTLYDLESGEVIEMVGQYDEFSERSYPNYQGGTSLQRWHRELLRNAMEAEGFSVYAYEWWHFDFDGWERYSIGNMVFDQID
jgi:CubicO group peptidase (beta-lactamase class C family)/D-alanyl-D-alanine dipeptidase